MGRDGTPFFGAVGPVAFPGDNRGGTLTVSVVATDGDGASTTLAGGPVTVRACPPPIS
jgi:hypothetical protein